jgi:UDP-3-O-[3-hydroxymyristoyl] N-acetylglucosamine deacetylase
VRHKILDVIGDLALVGRPVQGHVVARNAGHALNHLLVRELVKTARRWEDAAPNRAQLHVEAPWEAASRRRPRVAAH